MNSPSLQHAATTPGAVSAHVHSVVGQDRHSHSADARSARNLVLQTPAGARLQGVLITSDDRELEEHIVACAGLNERSYARFVAHGNPYDRDEAVQWMDQMHQAIGRRRREVADAIHAEIQQRIDAGAGYFIDRGDQARAALAGRAA
jgi:hypothetical protein